MATRTLCRAALRRNAVPFTLSLSTGLFLAHHNTTQHPIRLDTFSSWSSPFGRGGRSTPPPPPVSSDSRRPQEKEKEEEEDGFLNAEVIKQLSSGSLAGTFFFPSFLLIYMSLLFGIPHSPHSFFLFSLYPCIIYNVFDTNGQDLLTYLSRFLHGSPRQCIFPDVGAACRSCDRVRPSTSGVPANEFRNRQPLATLVLNPLFLANTPP
jgi:hypothetical protein